MAKRTSGENGRTRAGRGLGVDVWDARMVCGEETRAERCDRSRGLGGF